MLVIVLWCFLLVFWPVIALAVLVLYPVVWLLTLPLRIIGISVAAMLALLKAILFLPARILGSRHAA